jgi:hypothetical protein
MGAVLQLQKHRMPVAIDDAWIFMVGDRFRAAPGERAALIFGNREFAAQARLRRDLSIIENNEQTYAYFEDSAYLRTHRIPFHPLVAVDGIRGDPAVLTDGVSPPEGSPWDSPLTVVLTSTASTTTLAAPPTSDAIGMVLSVDGSDLYTIRCVDDANRAWSVGVVRSSDGPPRMRTRAFFSDDLAPCREVRITASDGDGAYSIGEIGFLRN